MKKKIIKFNIILLSLVIAMGVMMFKNPQVLNAQTQNEDNMSNLVLDKTANYNNDGSYTIRLESYVTGDVVVTSKAKPTDIVLVLDQSGSMTDPIQVQTDYLKVYSKTSNEMNSMGQHLTYYIQKNGKYVSITFHERIRIESSSPFNPEFFYVWKTSDGELVVALTETGDHPDASSPSSVRDYPAYQAFRKVESSSEGTPTKLESLKQAASTFINNAASQTNDHRIAIAGFATGEKTIGNIPPYTNTELFVGSKRYAYNSADITSQYASAFLSTANGVDSQPVKNLQQTVDSLHANGATRADLGMDMAGQIFANNSVNAQERNRVVIMFTDGVPTDENEFDANVANATIAKAKALKEQGISVYTIGVIDSLDNTLDPTNPTTDDLNRYMQYVSSNYPNAASLTQSGSGDYASGKYLFATNQEELMALFAKINEEITSTTSTLDETTVLKDVLSEQFKLGSTPEVKVYTQAYLGNNTWDNEVEFNEAITEIDPTTKEISVRNFNYKDHSVIDASTPTGQRLVVEIKVYPEDDFLGGNNVETNKNSSGIYVKEEMKKPFPLPTVNTATQMDQLFGENSIYQTQELVNLSDLLDANTKNADGIQYNLNGKQYTIDGFNNKYVNIKYEVLNNENQPLGVSASLPAGSTSLTWSGDTTKLNMKNLNSNTTYKLNITVTPITTSDKTFSAVEKKTQGEAKINVFKPTTTVKNDIAFYGGQYDLTQVVGNVTWECKDNPSAPSVKETQGKPELSYTYLKNGVKVDNPAQYQAEEESTFTMKVSANGRDITNSDSFKNLEPVDQATFKIDLIKGELQITKQVDKAYSQNKNINANQTFVFRIDVYHPTSHTLIESYYQSIDFDQYDFAKGTASKTITLKGLRAGVYEIVEEENWSWKYEMSASKTNYLNETKQLYIGNPDASISNGAYPYFGVETGTTYKNVDLGNPGKITIQNTLLTSNVIGDCASALNRFTK